MFELVPKNVAELTVIASITPDIVTVSFPFRRYGLIKIGGRGTIIRLANGSLAVFSPPPLTTAVKNALLTLAGSGVASESVAYLIVPDAVHTLWLHDWHTEFPKSVIVGPHGATDKYPSLPFAMTFPTRETDSGAEKDASLAAFHSEFDVAYFGSHADEIVLLHRPSKTIMVADLIFNPPPTQSFSLSPESADGGLLTYLFACTRGLEGAPLERQRKTINLIAGSGNAKLQFGESARAVLKWDFDRIILCHGDVIESGGKPQWEALFKNLL